MLLFTCDVGTPIALPPSREDVTYSLTELRLASPPGEQVPKEQVNRWVLQPGFPQLRLTKDPFLPFVPPLSPSTSRTPLMGNPPSPGRVARLFFSLPSQPGQLLLFEGNGS
jgi:hypothetical protein